MAEVDILRGLDNALQHRRAMVQLYNDYYSGRHRLTFATSKFKEAFGNLFAAFADNWCKVIVDTPVERLVVEGFRSDDATNNEAWKLWSGNDLDLLSMVAHTEAAKTGYAYVLVDVNSDPPVLAIRDAKHAICEYDSVSGQRMAGACFWLLDDGRVGGELYLPDHATLWQTKEAPTPGAGYVDPLEREWVQVDSKDYDTGGRVPLVPLINAPDAMMRGHSELASVIPMQDAINKLATDMFVASEFQAFKQRVLTGVEIPRDENGNPIQDEQMKAAMSRLWTFEPADAKVTELSATDLQNYVTAIEAMLQHVAAQTRTPPHYLLGSIVNVSGDALAAAESGLVSKCQGMQTFLGKGWRESMQIGLGTTDPIEVVWKNPERQSLAVVADAATKLQAILPREELLRLIGYSPLQIEKMKDDPVNTPAAPKITVTPPASIPESNPKPPPA